MDIVERVAWIDALLAPRGQELFAELAVARPTRDNEISLITRLRRSFPAALVAAAMEQHALRLRARKKFARADQMLFTAAGLEQASTEAMAAHHAARYLEFETVADLCTGIGGDALGLAVGHHVLAVDRDPVHARLARVNAAANGVGDRVSVNVGDVRDIALSHTHAVFIDPARRTADGRMSSGASEPSLAWCHELSQRVAAMGIKAAPGLPHDLAAPGWELEFVSEHRELKESLLWSPSLATAARRATVLPTGETIVGRGGVDVEVRAPGRFLIDPDPAVTRAGVVEELAESLGACWKVDRQVAFLSSDEPVATPFGRTLRIEASLSWSLSSLRGVLRSLGVGVVDIRKRGSAVDVDDIQRRLKLTGDRSATVVLTRVDDKPWMFVCFGLGAHLDLNSTSV